MKAYHLVATINESTKRGFEMRYFVNGKRVSQIKFKLVCSLAEKKSETIHKKIGNVDKYYMTVYF
jgi:hypothetical protein